jgi:mono/diheme cytochrome c family protein
MNLPLFVAGSLLGLTGITAVQPVDAQTPEADRALYERACAACHGADGTGTPQSQLGFDTSVPDFTDCSFASREPDADWIAVAHQGGPVRGFAPEMPAFGEALMEGELQQIMNHIRTMCGDDDWPRGELNLPRPIYTEKAYPEDEAVVTSMVDVEGSGAVMNEIVYEHRLGARNQIEIVAPFGFREGADRWSGGGLGDVAFGIKRALRHSVESGRIFSLAGEVILPTGDADRGFGAGTTRLEPFASFGQILPADAFLHLQGGAEIPLGRETVPDEAFWRAAIGRTFTQGRWGRAWSPMVEMLGSRAFADDATTHWDLVPQMQVTLNTRQHVMANVGVRLPLGDPGRDTQVVVYILWDWFDGGFFEGW